MENPDSFPPDNGIPETPLFWQFDMKSLKRLARPQAAGPEARAPEMLQEFAHCATKRKLLASRPALDFRTLPTATQPHLPKINPIILNFSTLFSCFFFRLGMPINY